MVYWCNNCNVPIFDREICPLCGNQTEVVSNATICNPVFLQERKLISFILDKDVRNRNVWYLGSGRYLVDGKRVRLPFRDFYKAKKHLFIAEELRCNIEIDDEVINKEKYLEANNIYLQGLVYEADTYVNETLAKYAPLGYIPTISFSGGKDSTVVSRLVKDSIQREDIIHYFGDTTLEFPDTYEYVEKTYREENPLSPMLPSETENDFYKLINVFGPPSKFERWCCTIFKTSNLNSEYQTLDGKSLTFLGIRRSESNERSKYERTQDHSKISTQINAMPIIDWTDYDVWLYLTNKGIKFNNAYKYGYKRVGCWCCPNNSDWSGMLTEIYFPENAKRWHDILVDFATKTNKTDLEDYIENGRWKTRKGASGLQTKNVNISVTPCNLSDKARNIIIKKKLAEDCLEFFKPLGIMEIAPKTDATFIDFFERIVEENQSVRKGKKIFQLIIVYGTNVIKVLPEKQTDVSLLTNRIKCQMRKYQFCIRCTACDSICPNGAIDTIQHKYHIDETKCKSCNKCIAKFYNGCITCQVLAGKKDIINEEE
jgi:phosphoadenosine phosphosulfate reductase